MAANQYFSEFGGCWTDRSDWATQLDAKLEHGEITADEAARVRFWIEHGYVILRGAVAPELCEQVAEDLHRAWAESDPRLLLVDSETNISHPLSRDWEEKRIRLVDVYAYYESARRALFAPDIVRFLSTVLEEPPLLFQSLSFHRGSEQGIHQDTAYVVSTDPMRLMASWIALEDVHEGSGELMYYDGSHRLPEHKFSGVHKHWNPDRDGMEQHDVWAKSLHTNSAAMGLPLRTFLPRRGDVLIWSADLAHGGAPIVDRSLTRRSLVGHYTAGTADPHYFSLMPDRQVKVPQEAGLYSSGHYTLRRDGPE